ncbi:MAG TPA: PqqD family peptide modification chaperone [Gammaproteobacteria bacterium]|nr:PqqD family peptide modification chaperone [Gammaproteobacteria bacterium]
MSKQTTHTISITEKQALITALPCFSGLSPLQSLELAELMEEIHFEPNEVIVEENSLIDCVYIVVEGTAEISHLTVRDLRKIKIKLRKQSPKMIKTPFAVLHTGESIGLNTTGFFSETGIRTATVTALTPMTLLSLDLKKLHEFLEKYPDLKSNMLLASKQMLKIQLIKQSLPFSRVSYDRLMWLANQVEEITVPAGTIIFKEGEMGDRCYLIQSGEVEIITHHEDNSVHQLAILKTPTLFGEATLITHASRNATARAIDDCRLLELKHTYLSELLESENNVANTFMTLMVDRSRPLKNPHVTVHQRVTPDEQTIFILKNPDNGSYFKLSEEGSFIWHLMDGQHTMQEITMKLSDEYNIFAPDVVAALISKLAKAQFVSQVDIDSEATLEKKSKWIRVMIKIRNLLEARIAFGDADRWITILYQKFAFIFFHPVGKILLGLIIISGVGAFAFSTPKIIHIFRHIHDSWILILFLIPFTLFSVALHELGHALATKYYGREVHYMGIGWYWMGPVAFTDTSDMWLSPQKGARIFVNFAGAYTDILVAGISALLIYFISNAYIQAFLWIFALFTYINAFRMLNPLQELDGYYALVDWFDRPRLRQSAVVWLVKEFPRGVRNPKLLKSYKAEIYYWLACILFMILISLLTLFVQTFIFKILGFKPSSLLVSLAFPIIVSLLSCMGIIADMRKQ